MEFSISLLQSLVIEEPKVISEFHNLVDALAKVCVCLNCIGFWIAVSSTSLLFHILQLATKPGSPDTLQQLVEMVKNPASNAASLSAIGTGKEDKTKQLRDKKVIGNTWFNRHPCCIHNKLFCSNS